MTLVVQSRRRKLARLRDEFPGAAVIDVTSRGPQPWICFSPFYPHGNIPVPFSPGYTSETVEGIWQGLKVFESSDVDVTKMAITNMKGIKRTTRKYGKVLGHRAGVEGNRLLSYSEARHLIYLPSYRWVLTNRLQDLIDELKRLGQKQDVVLLDYETNGDIDNLQKPLSHAHLIKMHIEEVWPHSTKL